MAKNLFSFFFFFYHYIGIESYGLAQPRSEGFSLLVGGARPPREGKSPGNEVGVGHRHPPHKAKVAYNDCFSVRFPRYNYRLICFVNPVDLHFS